MSLGEGFVDQQRQSETSHVCGLGLAGVAESASAEKVAVPSGSLPSNSNCDDKVEEIAVVGEVLGDSLEEQGKEAARRILANDQTFKPVAKNQVCEWLGGR